MRYAEARELLDTGDIVLFSGKGAVSSAIKRFTRSEWSHVGMAVRSHEWDLLLLLESTTLTSLVDLDTGTARSGVQVVPLSLRLETYDGEVGIRHVERRRTRAELDAVKALRLEFRGRPYEKDQVELLRAAWDGPFGDNTRDVSSLFCSETVAEFWQRALGWLRSDVPSNEFDPANFAGDGRQAIDGFLTIEPGALSPVEEVTR